MSEKIHYLLHGIQDRYNALYQENIDKLGNQDVLVASIGGSGQSFLGNILLELGLNYADAYTEVLNPDGTNTPEPAYADYRSRLAATAKRDGHTSVPKRRWPRFVKTHLTPEFFTERPLLGAWILVRDPRDALFSWYNFRIHFAKDPLDIRAGSFERWLDQPGPNGVSRLEDWGNFYDQWTEARGGFERTTVTTFEDLKKAPVSSMRAALEELGVEVPEPDLPRAVENSSFTAMRSGTANEWKSWMTPSLRTKFSAMPMSGAARRYGYRTDAPAHRAHNAPGRPTPVRDREGRTQDIRPAPVAAATASSRSAAGASVPLGSSVITRASPGRAR
ncbi:sulfotransferase domain-containing protein [Streptomyces sp. BB1-1-1]|uniref:sulfotransferase domain-containing protein n=1 Tax=Streptomyces sp. BB1-1-1 TaxID=3074430 RepID=UPI0028779109|nr:sulfotransferase domain-containing protein [Streptomyces sp. BB1-1-1]WND33484.1 sulfotransferase domain-containing protein [Streptomyces sp. BB1-1-1]